MKIRPFYPVYKKQRFSSLDELKSIWSQFDPCFMYDFSQQRGSLYAGIFSKNEFGWIQKDGKYYLDHDTFNNIPASMSNGGMPGYTDLILTSEAIKRRAWKLLSYKGRHHLPAFFKKFPEVKVIYEKAVWDSHTSLYAKNEGITTHEFLRTRALSFQT
jgi:hypothetical protein